METQSKKHSHAQLDASKLCIQLTTMKKDKVEREKLVFGQTFTDHMVEIDWSSETGWGVPSVKPFQDLSLSPATIALHYGLEVFEGLKAYKDTEGNVRLFRPEMNIQRMSRSCQRLAMPEIPEAPFLEILKEFVKIEADWIPEGRGYSLYLRPFVIGTEPKLSVTPTNSVKVVIIASPVGPYFAHGFAAVSLLADPDYVRAWPGGVGAYKVGGNYAPGMYVQRLAAQRGYDQLLWLSGEKHQVSEVGAMNFFVLWNNKSGEKELLTASLDGLVLPGVVRDTVLSLCRAMADFKVTERAYFMSELVEALEEKRVIEMFGSGTACIVTPVKMIGYQGKDYAIPMALGQSGELTKKLNDMILDIQYGVQESEFSVIVE